MVNAIISAIYTVIPNISCWSAIQYVCMWMKNQNLWHASLRINRCFDYRCTFYKFCVIIQFYWVVLVRIRCCIRNRAENVVSIQFTRFEYMYTQINKSSEILRKSFAAIVRQPISWYTLPLSLCGVNTRCFHFETFGCGCVIFYRNQTHLYAPNLIEFLQPFILSTGMREIDVVHTSVDTFWCVTLSYFDIFVCVCVSVCEQHLVENLSFNTLIKWKCNVALFKSYFQ